MLKPHLGYKACHTGELRNSFNPRGILNMGQNLHTQAFSFFTSIRKMAPHSRDQTRVFGPSSTGMSVSGHKLIEGVNWKHSVGLFKIYDKPHLITNQPRADWARLPWWSNKTRLCDMAAIKYKIAFGEPGFMLFSLFCLISAAWSEVAYVVYLIGEVIAEKVTGHLCHLPLVEVAGGRCWTWQPQSDWLQNLRAKAQQWRGGAVEMQSFLGVIT